MVIKNVFFSTVSLKKLFASFSAKENDAGNEKSIQEQVKEDIQEIKDLVKQKRFRKKRKIVLKLLDDLSAKVERCGGRWKMKAGLNDESSPIRPVMIGEF